ncbi:universal stress protein [Fulvivirga sp. RKSG066]|uniref:universal stress protein n=1 Tax=Fulvivirga aurantia TaxID=2529383 RepID=UPI0012BC9DC3|nr:universal stress protein [Fulvivirga aurantia]MTI21776.1 universal stress protein [Fulvivirga aurantia]
MELFNKIIVPVDFSTCSKNALNIAGDFCKKYNTSLTALNVLNIGDTVVGDEEKALRENRDKLEALCISLKCDYDIEIRTGLPYEEVVNMVKEGDYSLCIMGTNEKHGILSELTGTVALKVMQHSPIPVLIVPGNKSLNQIEKIAFATDFKKLNDNSLLNHIRALSIACDAELHLLNVTEEPEKVTAEEADEAMNLHEYLFDVNHAFFFAQESDPVEGIMNYVKKKDIDILAMMPRKHTFFHSIFNDSLSERIAIHLSVPLFSIHE